MARRKVCIEAIVCFAKGLSVNQTHMDFLSILTVSSAAEGGVVTRYQLRHEAEEDMKVTSK
jgi:hypothetical protein